MVAPLESRYKVTFVVLAVAAASFALLQSLVSPVLPLLQTELHTDQNTVTWVLTAYLLSASIFTPILGRVGDMVGKKKVLVVVLVVLALGSVLAALATSIGVMIVARAIQGVGGGVIPLAFGMIRDEFPRPKVGSAVGVIAAILAVGGAIGLVLAGPIVEILNYHWLFFLPAIVVALAAAGAHFLIHDSSVRAPGSINWLAAILMSGWLVALLLGVSNAPSWGWTSPSVLGLFALAAVLAVVWVMVETRSSQPLIDMRMMRIPAVWTTNLVALLFGAGMYSSFAFYPEFLQTPASAGYGFGATITESGLIVLPQAVTTFILGVMSGPLSRRFGAKWVLVAGSAITMVAFFMVAFAHATVGEFIVAMLVMGAGIGLGFSAMSNIVVDAVPSHQTGVASGMNANIRTIGGAIGAAVMGSIVTSQVLASGYPTEAGYTAGFILLGCALALATVASLLIPRISIHRDAHQEEQAAMSHPEVAMVAGATIVGDDPE